MTLQTLGDSRRSTNSSAAAAYHQQLFSENGQSLLRYLVEDRGLSDQVIKAFGLGAVVDPESGHDQYRGRICIPYLVPNGDVMKLRFRAGPGYEGNAKYMDVKGGTPRMFNTSALTMGGQTIYITEGEVEAMTLTQLGYPTVGIAGTQAWQPHFKRMLDGYSRIIVTVDNDDGGAGLEFANHITNEMEDHEVIHVKAPEGHDMNSAFVEFGAEKIHELLTNLKN